MRYIARTSGAAFCYTKVCKPYLLIPHAGYQLAVNTPFRPAETGAIPPHVYIAIAVR